MSSYAEPLNFVDKNAIRTKRLDDYINNVGLKTSSIEAKKQLNCTHTNISNNTILRSIKKNKNRSWLWSRKLGNREKEKV